MSNFFCTNCGNPLDENAMFCGECGTKVEFIPTSDNLVDEDTSFLENDQFEKNPSRNLYDAPDPNGQYEYEDPYFDDPEPSTGASGNGKNKNHLPLILAVTGAAAVIVLVLLISQLNRGSVNSASTGQNGQAGTTGSAESAGTEASVQTVSGTSEAAGTEDIEGTRKLVTARAEEVKTIYAQQIASYSDDSSSEVKRVDDATCYYVEAQLVEVDVPKGHNDSPYHRDYYYRDGDVYYVRVYETINEVTELYYENKELVGWRDPQGTFHDRNTDAAAYEQWNIYIDESQTTYNNYETVEVNTDNSEYVIANSDLKYLSAVDVQGLSSEELRLARNEIYARHGRTFKDSELQSHFDACSWYTGTTDPDTFDSQQESILSDIEKANISLIQEMESTGTVTSTAAQDAANAEAEEMAAIAAQAESEVGAAEAGTAEENAENAESSADESVAAEAEAAVESAATEAESEAEEIEVADAAEVSEAEEAYLGTLNWAPAASEYTSYLYNNYQYAADVNTGVVTAMNEDVDGDGQNELVYFELVNRQEENGTNMLNVLEMVVCEYNDGVMAETARSQVLEESILNGASFEQVYIAYADGSFLCTCVHTLTEANAAEYASARYDGAEIALQNHLYDPGYTSAVGLYDILESGKEDYYNLGTEVFYQDMGSATSSGTYSSYETAMEEIFADFSLTISDPEGTKEITIPEDRILCILTAEEQGDSVVSAIENRGLSIETEDADVLEQFSGMLGTTADLTHDGVEDILTASFTGSGWQISVYTVSGNGAELIYSDELSVDNDTYYLYSENGYTYILDRYQAYASEWEEDSYQVFYIGSDGSRIVTDEDGDEYLSLEVGLYMDENGNTHSTNEGNPDAGIDPDYEAKINEYIADSTLLGGYDSGQTGLAYFD